MSEGILGNRLIWEDIIYWPGGQKLREDWDVQLINGVPYVGANVPTNQVWTFQTPLHGGSELNNMKNYQMRPGTYAIDLYGNQIKLCKKLNYTSKGSPYCPNANYWNSSVMVDPNDVPYTSPSHPGFFLEDVMHSSCVGGDKCGKKNGNGKEGNACVRGTNWGNACVPKGKSECRGNVGGTPAEYLASWNKCYIDLNDSKNKFNTIKCRDNGCSGLTQSIVDYYTAPELFTCDSGQCSDDPTIYPDLQAVNNECKRGYNWGVENSGNLWVSKNCSSEFVNSTGKITSCIRDKCNKAPEYCDYTPKTCPISVNVMGDPNYSPKQECVGDVPYCVNGNTMKPATCLGTQYVCDIGECNTKYKPSEEHVCVNGVWKKSGSSFFMILLIIISIILVGLIVRHIFYPPSTPISLG